MRTVSDVTFYLAAGPYTPTDRMDGGRRDLVTHWSISISESSKFVVSFPKVSWLSLLCKETYYNVVYISSCFFPCTSYKWIYNQL